MSDVSARPTDHGTVLLVITEGDGRRAHVDLPIELAEVLKAQIEAALVTARVRRFVSRARTSQKPKPAQDS